MRSNYSQVKNNSGFSDSSLLSLQKSQNRRVAMKSRLSTSAESALQPFGSRWQNVDIQELHTNTCRVLKNPPDVELKNKLRPSVKVSRNVALRKLLQRSLRKSGDGNGGNGNQLVELYNLLE